MRLSTLLCAAALSLAATCVHATVPAHYVVFEMDAQGRAEPVFYTQVQLNDPQRDLRGRQPAERGIVDFLES